jgi:hypothetical protein
MSVFNRRLAPQRVLGLPLATAISALVFVTAALLAVVLPGMASTACAVVAVAAVPVGAGSAWVGDDIVFARVFWAHHRDTRARAQEALWF